MAKVDPKTDPVTHAADKAAGYSPAIRSPRAAFLAFLCDGATLVPMSPAALTSRFVRALAVEQGATVLTVPAEIAEGNGARVERSTLTSGWLGEGRAPVTITGRDGSTYTGAGYAGALAPTVAAAWTGVRLMWWTEGTGDARRTYVAAIAPDGYPRAEG